MKQMKQNCANLTLINSQNFLNKFDTSITVSASKNEFQENSPITPCFKSSKDLDDQQNQKKIQVQSNQILNNKSKKIQKKSKKNDYNNKKNQDVDIDNNKENIEKTQNAEKISAQNNNSKKLKILCRICGKGYTNKYSLHTHLKTLHKVKPHECEVCSESFWDLKEQKTHMEQFHLQYLLQITRLQQTQEEEEEQQQKKQNNNNNAIQKEKQEQKSIFQKTEFEPVKKLIDFDAVGQNANVNKNYRISQELIQSSGGQKTDLELSSSNDENDDNIKNSKKNSEFVIQTSFDKLQNSIQILKSQQDLDQVLEEEFQLQKQQKQQLQQNDILDEEENYSLINNNNSNSNIKDEQCIETLQNLFNTQVYNTLIKQEFEQNEKKQKKINDYIVFQQKQQQQQIILQQQGNFKKNKSKNSANNKSLKKNQQQQFNFLNENENNNNNNSNNNMSSLEIEISKLLSQMSHMGADNLFASQNEMDSDIQQQYYYNQKQQKQ